MLPLIHKHLNSKQYYKEDAKKKKSEKLNNRDVTLVSGTVPQNPGCKVTVQCGVPPVSILSFFLLTNTTPTICHHQLLNPKPTPFADDTTIT